MTQQFRIELRPQPVGIFPPPASNLLLPPASDEGGAIAHLLAGEIAAHVPSQWLFFVAAARGDIEQALRLLEGDASPLAVYNRFVLAPSLEEYWRARENLSGELAALLQVAAYSAGVIDAVDAFFRLDGELLALALATSAAEDIHRKKLSAAGAKLKNASAEAEEASPLLAAMLLSQFADVMSQAPGFAPAAAILEYRQAIRLVESRCTGGPLPPLLPELYVKLGMALQQSAQGDRAALLEAVNAYQTALQQGVGEESHPELFAQIQNNLGLAYLTIPAQEASRHLRAGIAVQSFRRALQVYTPEKHPDMWASVSMNLANALQYAPSSHPEENLIQAVETYETVLHVRSRARDPLAYALVIFNQANALAHLGIFKAALEKLAEAYKLFQWYESTEHAAAAQELLERIHERMSERGESLAMSTS